MSVFQEVVLSWNDKEYKIAPDRVMGAIARIENVITLKEIASYAEREDLPMARIAMAYGEVLRYAGAKVTDADVYQAMFSGDTQSAIVDSVNVLLMMMIPPDTGEKKAPRKKTGKKKTKA